MLYNYKNINKQPKEINLEWINNFIYAHVYSFVSSFFEQEINEKGRFKDPLFHKDNCQYFQKGLNHFINGEDYEGKITVFNKSNSFVYSNFFNLLLAFEYGKKKNVWISEWELTNNTELIRKCLDLVKNWISNYPDEEIDSELTPENISDIQIFNEMPINLNEFEKEEYCFNYNHKTIEENFENSYPGFKFSDFSCDSWQEFKQRYLITAFDGYIKKHDDDSKKRYSQIQCKEFGIYTLKWFKDQSFLKKIKTSNSALYFLLLNYYCFEIRNNHGEVIALRWRYKNSNSKLKELNTKGYSINKYMNMSAFKQKYQLINLHNYLNRNSEEDYIILIESLSDIPFVYSKFGKFGDNFIATGTCGLTAEQIQILKYLKRKQNFKIYLAFDTDFAGSANSDKFKMKLEKENFEVYKLPFKGKDFEDNNLNNADDLKKAISDAEEIVKIKKEIFLSDDLPF